MKYKKLSKQFKSIKNKLDKLISPIDKQQRTTGIVSLGIQVVVP